MKHIMKKLLFITVVVLVFCLAAFAQTPDPDCPSFSLTGPSYAVKPGETMRFIVEVGKEAQKYDVKYFWSVSAGKIVSGQESKILTVINETGDVLTATIEIKGLPEKCPNTLSETGSIADAHPIYPILSDEFDNFGRSGTKGRIDSFLYELLNDKNAKGFIVFRDDKDLLKRIIYLRDYTVIRKFPLQRLTIVISDKDVQLTEFWRVPPSATFEDRNASLVFKLKDFEALQKLFTPKIVKPKTKK